MTLHQEPIEKCLAISGVGMDFGIFQILGIPGFNISVLYKGEQSLYEIERQNFSFQISTEDAVKYQITGEEIFTMNISVREYRFKVERSIEDLTGWTKLSTSYLSGKDLKKEDV